MCLTILRRMANNRFAALFSSKYAGFGIMFTPYFPMRPTIAPPSLVLRSGFVGTGRITTSCQLAGCLVHFDKGSGLREG